VSKSKSVLLLSDLTLMMSGSNRTRTPLTRSFTPSRPRKCNSVYSPSQIYRMCDFYNADESVSVIPPSQYLPFGSYAAVLHHTTDEFTGKEVGKWYRVQVFLDNLARDYHLLRSTNTRMTSTQWFSTLTSGITHLSPRR
jgi:hypothetical protein